LDRLLPRDLPLFSAVLRLPGGQRLADAAYRWVSANRSRLPGRPTCPAGHDTAPLAAADVAELARRANR